MARQKLSYECSVLVFWPKLQPRPRVGERTAPPTPPCHPPTPTTSNHCLIPPFYAAPLKPSYECLVSGFWHKPCPLPSCWQTCSPPTTSMPSTCTNNLLSSPHTIISNGTPETESPLSVFGFFDPHSSHTRAASPPQPPCPQHSTTSPRYPPRPFALILSRCTRFLGFCSVYIIFCNLLHNNDNNTLSDKCGNEFNNYIRFLH